MNIKLQRIDLIKYGLSDPDQFIQFSDEDKAKMAHTIITELPLLDTEHLQEVYNTLKNNLSKGKTK